MNEMIERVSAALAARHGLSWERMIAYDPNDWRLPEYRKDALAVIAAMREPTERMVDAAMAFGWQPEPLNIGYDDAWRSMIDAALKES